MAHMFYDKDADLELIRAKKVAIVGYGSQGHAHALNLKDSGVDVRVGLAAGSTSKAKAEAAGLKVTSVAEAAEWADVIMMLAPDTKQPKIYRESVEPHLKAGKMLMFGHGFNIRYNTITPPADVDVSMIAPKAPGHRARELIVDLMYRGGLNYMRYSISDTAEHGDYTGGPRLITEETMGEMKKMLGEIQDGTYARKWITENENGRPWFNETRRREQDQPIEKVGAELRAMMPFLNPVTVRHEEQG